MTKKPRNRMAQDTNLINLNALKKRVKVLENINTTRDREEKAQDKRIASLEKGIFTAFMKVAEEKGILGKKR